MTCYSGFGNLAEDHPTWQGDFTGEGCSDILFYYPGDDNWWLGSHQGPGGQIAWSFAGNTAGFGHAINDGRPFWTGRFSRADRHEMLFYYPGDGNWWLGTHNGNQLVWSYAGNTKGANPTDPNFGEVWDGRPVWIGDFTGDGRADVLFYYPGDGNWWLGSHNGNQLIWSYAGNTKGANPTDPNFGEIWDGRPVWISRFSRADRDEVLFYYPGDGNWWLGTYDGSQFIWSYAGNTKGANPTDPNFGEIWDGRPVWIADFTGDSRADILFYYPGDDNWWLGSHQGPGGQIAWSFAGNTAGFGHAINDGRPFWTGRFSRADRDEMLFYFPGDGNWWLGTHDGSQLIWNYAGNTKGANPTDPNFGEVWDGRPVRIGNFSRPDRAEVLFYYPGDGNWWLGSHNGSQLAWSFAGNTGRPCQQSVIVHFKSLLPINNNINNFIDTQYLAMHELFAEGGVAIYRGTTEDLSGNANLQTLQNLNVGACLLGQPTQDQNTLFANRNNVGNNELVVYIVTTLIGGAGNFVGCATHPTGQPGAAVVQSTARWLVAHEIGHVLDLRHVSTAVSANSDRLMWPNTGWTNPPPDLVASEYTTMLNSNLTNPC